MQLPALFETRMRRQLGADYEAYQSAMEQPPARGVRVNTLKTDATAFLPLCGLPLAPSGIAPEGFVLTQAVPALGAHPLHQAGLFYIQEPSAMCAVTLLDPQPGMRVLDLCAAPGGKATQIAARMQGAGLLVANEYVPGRAQTLARNLERMGVRNALCCAMRPDGLAALLPAYFDAILVDAPCSGEGMFRKEPQAVEAWSPEHVTACARRQSKILDDAASMLTPGGRLVYATCTFSEEENEDTITAFLQAHPDFSLVKAMRLWPHTTKGEGHFAALLHKAGSAPVPASAALPIIKDKAVHAAYEAFRHDTMTAPPAGTPYLLQDGRLLLLPDTLPVNWQRLRIISAGVQAGEWRNGRLFPAHALFMAYPKAAFTHSVELSDDTLAAYLTGSTLPVSQSLSGWCAVCTAGHVLGFGKAVDGTLKNHLPKGLRNNASIRYTDIYGTD